MAFDIIGIIRKIFHLGEQPSAAPEGAVLINPADIKVDADAYQFRIGGDENGVVAHRHDNQQIPDWQKTPLLIHERLDGSMFVADGHHRLDLIRHLRAEGKGPEKVYAHVLRETEGYSVKDAKIYGAFANIAEGTNNLLESARVLQEANDPDVHQALLPPLDINKGNLRDALMLSTALSSDTLNYALQTHMNPSEVLGMANATTTLSSEKNAPGQDTLGAFTAMVAQRRSQSSLAAGLR